MPALEFILCPCAGSGAFIDTGDTGETRTTRSGSLSLRPGARTFQHCTALTLIKYRGDGAFNARTAHGALAQAAAAMRTNATVTARRERKECDSFEADAADRDISTLLLACCAMGALGVARLGVARALTTCTAGCLARGPRQELGDM